MFKQYINEQYSSFQSSVDFYKINPNCLIDIERFVMNEILHFIELQLPEIVRDYNEASYLHPFWKNFQIYFSQKKMIRKKIYGRFVQEYLLIF